MVDLPFANNFSVEDWRMFASFAECYTNLDLNPFEELRPRWRACACSQDITSLRPRTVLEKDEGHQDTKQSSDKAAGKVLASQSRPKHCKLLGLIKTH